jgi:hypothetical protein
MATQSETNSSDAANSLPPQPAQPIYAQASSVGDQAAARDSLGFKLYVEALADFLLAENTRPPLTFSVEGTWGSGKSSFMLQLKNRIRAVSRASKTIDFNAWKYDEQEELWAAFALNLALSLRNQTRWPGRFWGDLKLYVTRIKGWSEGFKLLCFAAAWLLIFAGLAVSAYTLARASDDHRAAIVKQTLDFAANPAVTNHTASSPNAVGPSVPVANSAAERSGLHPVHYWIANSSLWTAVVLIMGLIWKIPDSFRKRLFSTQIEQYIDKPDYKGKAAFLDTFSKDFAKTVSAYSGARGSKIFVFIDDLDRCEAPKAADLMQSINLMIGEGNSLIFILGLDRAKVAASIGFKFREMIPYLQPTSNVVSNPLMVREFGDSFLEKFIQLSFRLPISSNEEQAHKFIDSLLVDPDAPVGVTQSTVDKEEEAKLRAREPIRVESGPESQRIRDVVMMVREILDHSPRRIKNFLNSFRLSLYIASAQGLMDIDRETGQSEVTPERLGKFLALTNRYPELFSIAVKNREFFGDLERALRMDEFEMGGTEKQWLGKQGVKNLLSYSPPGLAEWEWAAQYSLREFPAWKFESVLPSLVVPLNPRLQSAASADARADASGPSPTGAEVPDFEASSFENSSYRAPARAEAPNSQEEAVSLPKGEEVA